MASPGCASTEPNVRLFKWERGIGIESREQPDMAMYLWFYEWHMFDAVRTGQHTSGGYEQFKKQVSETRESATLTSDYMTLKAKAGRDAVDLSLTITNRSDHDWPDIAGIIPCFNPGPQDRRNKEFANTRTYFVGSDGLVKQHQREIHFNHELRSAIDQEADQGKYVFSHKWPTSEVDAVRGLLMRESTNGQWVSGISWEEFLSAQGHNPWQCMHLCIRVGPLNRNESRTLRGRIYLFKGDKEDCYRRYLKDFE
jgi:hypothetical protein